jgi:hypothetical protein
MVTKTSSVTEGKAPGLVIVSAGRRVDPADAATKRFPAENVAAVRARIEEVLKRERPVAIVSSAACGADLLLLQASIQLELSHEIAELRRFVLLPSPPEEFRRSSVIDRPGDWGEIYEQVLHESSVEVLKLAEGHEGYTQTNLKLFDRALAMAAEYGTAVHALVIWNKESRGPDDVTAHFLEEAKRRHIPVTEISTR